ncbi:hypothetical protein DPMN_028914 [Dreissena polymorpha]|uniref:Uncharacterized protein n=1 Tax=Dreissena polymorpha TaxID=45954 RepID=A0A9D4LX58_DREPO|nr:hypothetical protein DPMN_028914 [Dreissena polymorpha]
MEKCPAPGSHVFQPTGIIFELIQDIIGMNLLTKFHEDQTVNVASRVLPRYQFLTKFHEDWTINVPSREKCPAPGGHVFKATKTIYELIQDIIGTNLLTKFHDDRKITVTSSPRPCGGHVFQPTGIIFELVQDIIGMNLLTEFHEDRTLNVASRVKNAPPLDKSSDHEDRTINVASRVLTRFYYSHIRKNVPPLGSHVFQAKDTIFELIKDISGMNLLTKFHEDQTINVASRVLTRFYYSHIRKNALPLGSHVFQANVTIFELIQDIIETNLLTKFHENWTINVASRE